MSSFSKGVLPDISGWSTCATLNYAAFRLAEVEAWVAHHLDDWLSHAMTSEKACSELSDLMITYVALLPNSYYFLTSAICHSHHTIHFLTVTNASTLYLASLQRSNLVAMSANAR